MVVCIPILLFIFKTTLQDFLGSTWRVWVIDYNGGELEREQAVIYYLIHLIYKWPGNQWEKQFPLHIP